MQVEDPEIVTYTFLGFAGGACPVFEKEVTIEVFPGYSGDDRSVS